jgi:hypothetical protein
MDHEEAKHILQLCRPGNDKDHNDPLIAQALERLDTDAELQAWFEAQQAFDAQISAALQRIEPPADLKTSILAGMRAHQAQSQAQNSHPQGSGDAPHTDGSLPFPEPAERTSHRPWFKPWMGMAAALAVIFAILARPIPDEAPELATNLRLAPNQKLAASPRVATASVPNVIEFLANEISAFKGSKFDKRDAPLGELRSHLTRTGMPCPHRIPEPLDRLPAMGCVTFDYNGTKLSMICFKNGQVYHLITADKANFPAHCSQRPQSFACNQQAFKLWTEGDQVLILCTEGTLEDLTGCK